MVSGKRTLSTVRPVSSYTTSPPAVSQSSPVTTQCDHRLCATRSFPGYQCRQAQRRKAAAEKSSNRIRTGLIFLTTHYNDFLSVDQSTATVDLNTQWEEDWLPASMVNCGLTAHDANQQPGFDLSSSSWTLLNRFSTGTRTVLHKSAQSRSSSQTMRHRVRTPDLTMAFRGR